MSNHLPAYQTQLSAEKHLKGVKNILAVASGKGGVGKSTVSLNLALGLQALGYRVGLMDADIYGPSQPLMLGALKACPESLDEKTLEPILRHGLQTMSIGYLVEDETAMAWRGPMASKALMQMMEETRWKDLDFLILDLPPGTGDIQLTLAQKIPVTAGIVVTTPQDLALVDVKRALSLFKKVRIPVLGVVENMSVFHCPHCKNASAIFGEGGAEKLFETEALPTLAKLPLSLATREHADQGKSLFESDPNRAESQAFLDLAKETLKQLQKRPKIQKIFSQIKVSS